MRIKGLKIGKSKKSEEETAVAEETPEVQTAETEEPIKAEQPSEEVADTASNSEETEANENTSPQPHGPLGELSIEPNDQLQELDEDVDTDALLGEDSEEIQVVEVSAGAGGAAPEEAVKVVEVTAEGNAPAEGENKPEKKKEETSDSLHNLFDDDEEEENPLANLINSLPDVTTQELLDDLEEIQGIINDQQR